jgi:hypothetical protein
MNQRIDPAREFHAKWWDISVPSKPPENQRALIADSRVVLDRFVGKNFSIFS